MKGRTAALKIETILKELNAKNEELQAIRDVAGLVSSTFNISTIIEFLYSVFQRFTGCDRCFICLPDEISGNLVCRYEYGEKTFDEVGNIYDDDTSIKNCFVNGQSMLKLDCHIKVRNSNGDKMAIPVKVSGALFGVVFLESGVSGTFCSSNLKFLESLCSYAAIALMNAELINNIIAQKQEIESLYQQTAAANEQLNGYVMELGNARNELNVKNLELVDAYSAIRKGYLQTVTALANSIEAMDPYTRGHCHRVMEISCKIARKLKLSEKQVEDLRYAAILHDIGKIGVTAHILKKPEKLTFDEMQDIKKHPRISYNILKEVEFLKGGLPAIHQHHERYDGNGYPQGLKGEKIDLLARILCVADAFDAMTTDRPYRKAMSVQEAIIEIQSCSGTQFDPDIASVMVEILWSEYNY